MWRKLNVSTPESPYLAFIVGLHVATALALLVFFRQDWIRIIGGFLTSVRHRRIEQPYERLAWLLILATIPVGITGLLLEHTFRTTLGRPMPAAAFLFANGLILAVGERLRRRAVAGSDPEVGPGGEAQPDSIGELRASDPDEQSDVRLAALSFGRGTVIGSAQILALLPGISRSGVTMVAGLLRGLSHEDAARFSFLLATPVILAAGALKIPDLAGPLGAGIRGPVLAGSAASFVTAYLSVRFLTRYFVTGTLWPFAWCSLAVGAGSFAVLAAR